MDRVVGYRRREKWSIRCSSCNLDKDVGLWNFRKDFGNYFRLIEDYVCVDVWVGFFLLGFGVLGDSGRLGRNVYLVVRVLGLEIEVEVRVLVVSGDKRGIFGMF